jgi:hypothetical protein
MSYTCRLEADTTYKEWSSYCYSTTGVSNTYIYKEQRYSLQVGRSQDDDAITGSVYLLIDNPDIDGQYLAYKKGTFRIEPNGIATRYPTGLKDLLLATTTGGR